MKRAIFVAMVGAGLIATAYRDFNNRFGRSEAEEARWVTSWSSDQAERDSILLSRLEVESTSLDHDGREILFADAWIEKFAVYRFPLVWFRKRVPAGGFVVVIKVRSVTPPSPIFWPAQGGTSFTSQGGEIWSYFSETEPEFPMLVTMSRGKIRVPAMTLKKPNQALQTTPVARSVYEKIIEFGRPQRGV